MVEVQVSRSVQRSEFRDVQQISTYKVNEPHLRFSYVLLILEKEQSKGNRKFSIFAMQVLVQKCLDQQKDVYACFFDYEKAFDIVKHDELIESIESFHLSGLDTKDIRVTKIVYYGKQYILSI